MTEPEAVTFRIELEGDTIRPGKVSFRDLKELSENLQAGVERVARVLIGEPGIAPGPLPKQIREATDLLLKAVEIGSAVLVAEMPASKEIDEAESQLFPSSGLGPLALDKFVAGLHQLETQDSPQVPAAWDNAVMEVAQKLGEFSADRQVVVTLKPSVNSSIREIARISPSSVDRFQVRHAPIKRPRTQRGLLIMVDLGRGRVDLEYEEGKRAQCTFPAAMRPQVEQLVGQVVEAVGVEDYDAALNKVGKLDIKALGLSFQQTHLDEAFWRNPSLEELSAEQGVKPLALEDFSAGEFTDEDIDSLMGAINSSRGDQ